MKSKIIGGFLFLTALLLGMPATSDAQPRHPRGHGHYHSAYNSGYRNGYRHGYRAPRYYAPRPRYRGYRAPVYGAPVYGARPVIIAPAPVRVWIPAGRAWGPRGWYWRRGYWR